MAYINGNEVLFSPTVNVGGGGSAPLYRHDIYMQASDPTLECNIHILKTIYNASPDALEFHYYSYYEISWEERTRILKEILDKLFPDNGRGLMIGCNGSLDGSYHNGIIIGVSPFDYAIRYISPDFPGVMYDGFKITDIEMLEIWDIVTQISG